MNRLTKLIMAMIGLGPATMPGAPLHGIVNEPDEEGDAFGHLLGEYEAPEAKRVLEALKRHDIPFELNTRDEVHNTAGTASRGRYSKLRVWVEKTRQAEAERIQDSALNVQT